MAFIEAAALSDVPVGRALTVRVADTAIAIFNVDGTIYAIADSCVHAGASLGAGKVNGRFVTCRAHGMRYDITTGEVTSGGLRVASYATKVVDGKILISID